MNKNINFVMICFLIGEFLSLLILNFHIYISIFLKGYIRIVEPNAFILTFEIISLIFTTIIFICFIINYIKKVLFD